LLIEEETLRKRRAKIDLGRQITSLSAPISFTLHY
jgi:hypothetical protein